MSMSNTFTDWYDSMKSYFAADAKGEDLEACVDQVMDEGHDEESAYAICNASEKADVDQQNMQAALSAAKGADVEEADLPAAYVGVLQKAGYDVDADEVLPGEKAGDELMAQTRQVMARGHDRDTSLVIAEETLKAGLEDDHRDELLTTAKEVTDYPGQVTGAFKQLVEYAGVDTKGEADLELPKVCRKCETETRIKGNFMCPDCHPEVDPKADEYELVDSPVSGGGDDGGETEKAGGDRPERVAKVYLREGAEVPEDAVVKSDENGLYYEPDGDVDQKAVGDDEWSAETRLFRIVPASDDDTEYESDVLGVGVSFPEAGVYCDWHREAFPDQLEEPHVSEYGSLDDLKKATQNEVIDVTQPPGVSQKADPMANGHQLDPETGEGTCETTGKAIEAETMQDLTEDCPHCGEALSVLQEKAIVGGSGN